MRIDQTYSSIDVHVAGEAFRIIQNVPFIHYQSLEELYERFPQAFHDEIKLLLNEPRGFAGLNGCLVIPPINCDADAAVLFFNHEGTVQVQYAGLAAVITALLEFGQLKMKDFNKYKIETVHGVVPVTAVMEEGEVVSVTLESDPCQVVGADIPLSHPHLKAKYSLVETDQLYAVFDKQDFPIQIELDELAELNKWGKTVLKALEVNVSGVILMDHTSSEEGQIKTITFRNDGYIARSPGFGTTFACYTSLLSSGRLPMDGTLINKSIFGSELKAGTASQTEAGYTFKMTSRSYITGMQTFILDPADPLAFGFILK
ncbi:proline racemase family protein [Neobacillus mesonae]|uniref:proline racemase family protein n=1 Tax=Neobacillus mesonae TaxID=1193713 RepID=UPI00203F67EE|nr:proline racemase family protein [Neobacillus mesonae]MCM3569959.1 proline racemase family protein [Neobacillus mesonae]